MQTRNKKVVFGILLSALVVGIMLTIGQVPLAVSQPVTIPVKQIKGPIPMDGANPIWESVPGVVVPLSGQTITTPMHPNISVKAVFVKAVSNGKEIGFRLDWPDQTLNNTTIGPQDFRDQAALQFPVNTSGAPPFQCMGQSGGTVNIWRWNAEWQKDIGKDSAGIWDVDDQYPSLAWDYYFEEPAGGVTYPDRIGRSLGPFNPGIWSGNILSDPTLRRSSVEDLSANGFSTLTTQAHQDVIGNGVWEPYGAVKGGCCTGPTWRIVVKRELTTSDQNDVQFKAGASVPVAFAVWDGSNVERNGMKGISTWFTLKLP
ncbi:MAG: ethylbenzene dehydrogenase-related protein [Nitrospirota bacterium]